MYVRFDFHDVEIRRFCVAVQKRVLDGIVDREVEKGKPYLPLLWTPYYTIFIPLQ